MLCNIFPRIKTGHKFAITNNIFIYTCTQKIKSIILYLSRWLNITIQQQF